MSHPVAWETLLAYWLGELLSDDAEALEVHYLGCGECAQRLESIAALADGIRAAVREGAVDAIVSVDFLERMRAAGLRVREYAIEPGGSAYCTIRAEDDAVASRLSAPLAGVSRLDVRAWMDDAELPRLEDVPFDATAGEVVFLPSAAEVRTLPAHTYRIELRAVGPQGERVIGEYTLLHTPS